MAQQRLPAATLRSKMFGPADQLNYQASQRAQRENFSAKLKRDHDAAYAAGRKRAASRAASGSGSSAGTMGGSRAALFGAMFGR
jgi:hypothetical protein